MAVEVDERVAAKAGLEVAEEELQSLCASHAGTFVSVERRGRALEVSLEELLQTVQSVESIVSSTQEALEQEQEEELDSGSSGRGARGTGMRENSLAALSEKHRVRRRTLLQHSSLLELLELPSLMDACVRSNLYEEALSISAFANTLERRHGHNNININIGENKKKNMNQVVVKVIAQVRSRQSDLRRYLLHSLKHHVTMPECLEIVTALRRLNSIDLERLPPQSSSSSTMNSENYSKSNNNNNNNIERVFAAMELSLQVDFLEARDTWLDQQSTSTTNTSTSTTGSAGGYTTTSSSNSRTGSSSNSSKSALQHSSSEQLLDTIERYRTRMFEIATQFNAIFRAQQTSHIANGQSSGSSNSNSNNNNNNNNNNDGQVSVSLLSMWTSRRIHTFLKILAAQLQLMDDSGSLRDALDACVFFTGSMGRLGADFTAQLPPLFEQKLLAIVLNNWKEGTTQLAETLKICRDAGVASPLVSNTVVATTTTTTTTTNAGGEYTSDASSSGSIMMAPPRQLMALPPLGRLVNACLTGLNELRRCLLPGIFSQLRDAVEKGLLLETKNILHAHERAVMSPGLRGDAAKLRANAKEMKNVTKTIVFPYVRGAVELSLGNEAGAKEHFDRLRKILNPPAPPPPVPVPVSVPTPEPIVEEEDEKDTASVTAAAAPVETPTENVVVATTPEVL